MANKKNKQLKRKAATRSRSSSPSKLKLKLAISIAALGILLYANTLGHQYALDDYSVIKSNYVTQQGWKGIPTIWTTAYRYGYWNSAGVLYRPISLTMFALEWALFPDNPIISHFVNVLLYGLCGFLLFYMLAGWFKKYTLIFPFLAALLFIAHPIHTEVVANIKSRDELLVLAFALASFWWLWKYLEFNKRKHLILSVFAYGLAMFSKESAITLLAVYPLALYFFSQLDLRRLIRISSLFLLPVLLFLMVRQSVLGSFYGANISTLDNLLQAAPDYSARMSTAFLILGRYLKTLLIPHPLSHDLGYNQISISSWANWQVLLSLVSYTALGLWALVRFKAKSPISFGILFFLITFSIGSNLLILGGTSYAERMLFLPSFGYAVVLAYLILFWTRSGLSKKKGNQQIRIADYKPALGISLLIVVLFSIKTISRNPAWENSFTLYETDIKTAANSAKLQYHYGLELVSQAKSSTDANTINDFMSRGVNAFNRAIEIYPTYGDAYAELGLAAYRAKDYEKALQFYEKSLELKPNNSKVISNMGVIYSEQGDPKRSIELYKQAISLDPRYVDALRNLGVMYAQSKNFTEAIKYFSQALQFQPEDWTLNNYLGMAYRDSGDLNTAKQYLQKAERLKTKE